MSANMTIDQAGLPAGTAGKARTDGLATGALVTLDSSGGGTTNTFRFLWVPPADTTAVASLAQIGPTNWTFTPTAAVYGTYRIELIVDEGLSTEDRQVRIFAIRTPTKALRVPALNEIASSAASLLNAGAAQIAASEDNEDVPGGPFAAGNYGGWYRELQTLFDEVEAGGGGSALTVREQDGTPTVANVTEIRVPNASLTDEGGGAVSIAFPGGGGGGFLHGANNELVSILGSEVVLGGFVLDGSSGTHVLRSYLTISSLGADVDLLLYDRGAPGAPVAGVLRSTINIATLSNPATATQALTTNGAPGVNVNEIFNTTRMYEIRAIINNSVPLDSALVYWAGLEIT